jgi:hypothetical protein
MPFKIEAKDFNVIFLNDNKQVVVTDTLTCHYHTGSRLPGSTLLSIIDNILRMSKTPFILKGNTQEWSYTPNGSYNLETYYDGQSTILLTLDEDETGNYTLELLIVEGTYEDFVEILAL